MILGLNRAASAFVAVAVLLATLVVSAAPSGAHGHCSGGEFEDDNGGGASGYCAGGTPGRGPGSASDEAIWNRYCGDLVEPYREGLYVDFYHEITYGDDPEDWDLIVQAGWDPSGLYYGHVVFCMDGTTDPHTFLSQWDYAWWAVRQPVPPTDIRDIAAARINPPAPSLGSNPPFNERPSVVQLQTWLWINDPWEAIIESETQGLVTVEVEAVPQHVDWAFSDGGSTRCEGPGIPWSAGAHNSGTYCQYTFSSSSADQPNAEYTATASVTWEFSWWLNGVAQGSFTTITTTTGFTVAVGEIQAVETAGE